VEYTKLYPAVQHQYLESPAPQDGLTNMPESSLPVDQFQMTVIALTYFVRPLILTLMAGFSSYQDMTNVQMTTILLKVKLLFQRTFHPSYPGVTQDTRPKHNTDNIGHLFVTVFAFVPNTKIALKCWRHPDTRNCPLSKSCTGIDS
jgi:hypothetical protein